MYKLVIVDDDSFMLKMLSSAFDWEEMGFVIDKTFSSSESCLQYLKEHSVDGLLTDIVMPNTSGLDIAKICSEFYPNIGIVIISAHSDFKYAREAIKYNVIDYLLKPINDDELHLTMNRLKQYLDKLNASPNNDSLNSDVTLTENSTISKIKEYVSEHYGENITVNDIAAYVMLNPNYFGQYFKRCTGESFSQYLQTFRIQKACELLTNTDMKISTIAEITGYKATTRFFQNFYKHHKMTPAEYRKIHSSTID